MVDGGRWTLARPYPPEAEKAGWTVNVRQITPPPLAYFAVVARLRRPKGFGGQAKNKSTNQPTFAEAMVGKQIHESNFVSTPEIVNHIHDLGINRLVKLSRKELIR